MLSSIFQRKEARSGGTPDCLHSDHDRDQSVDGLDSSALHFLISLHPVTVLVSMVIKSSVSSLVQSFSDIVMILREELL